jgi:hypothetical protein
MLSLTGVMCLVWLVVAPVALQMEAYLKASRFRQTIEQHKRAMGGGNAMGPTPAGQVLQVGRLEVMLWWQAGESKPVKRHQASM